MFNKNENTEKPEAKYDVKYISGHSMHPKEKDTQALFFADRLELKKLEISIPYSAITKLSGQDDRHITKTRVFMTGIIPGLFWKKIYPYTLIEYNDGFMDQSILLVPRFVRQFRQLGYHGRSILVYPSLVNQ